ncbi:MAG: hypothetical protein KME05_07670 [Gloeocapsa sp. UFS-A4-WI-NPMV-4B04]|jgi:predicted RNase H-like nuclease (RuvC/YqgF family)|nr:hypothetical protein [Gloeocapsa sp. UFS-A4-WI-NPMV-4B04]
MNKKRLSDLLRDEAQKSPDESIEEVVNNLEVDITLPETESLDETLDEHSPVNTTSRTKRTNPTKAELETTLTELQEALQAAQMREESLGQQVVDLQLELQEQKLLVKTLQPILEQTNQLKTELEQAKKVILQLSEINSKSTQSAITPKKEAQVNYKPTQSAITPKKESEFRAQNLNLKKLPHHSIQPPQSLEPNPPDSPGSNSKLSNKDIGWFD